LLRNILRAHALADVGRQLPLQLRPVWERVSSCLAGERPLTAASGDMSYFRIEKVRYADVARVDCRVTRVSKAMKTYDEMLNDRR
jgi:hypothetical protein